MANQRKMWINRPSKSSKPKIPGNIKTDLEWRAGMLIEKTLKPQHIKPPLENTTFNYIVDIFTKWNRNYFYFCSEYHCPGPNAISPTFEDNFARLEYIGDNNYNLAFKRHTGQWMVIYEDISAEECMSIIKDDPNFYP